MKSALWFIVGTAVGFVVAHQVNSTTRGRAFFETFNEVRHDFLSSLVDGYRTREAELRSDDAA